MPSADPTRNNGLTIEQIVGEGLDVHFPELSIEKRRERIEKSLLDVQMDSSAYLPRYPHEFSGGQRQRVAIARALLADAPLLLLDDALSAVDTDTEHRILQHLRAQRQGRTVIVVSHRLSAVMDADAIAVLRQGQLVELGTHEALLAKGVQAGWYAHQWRIQQLETSLGQA